MGRFLCLELQVKSETPTPALEHSLRAASPSPGFALSQAGAGAGGEITFEISGYDAYGRLVSVYNDNYTASYAYNHDGLRASKTVTEDGVTSTTRFLYNSGYIVLELDGAGAQTAFNVFGGGSVISRTTAQGTDFYLYNGRGDVVQLTNSAGSVTATYDYDAFGNLLSVTDHLNPFRYCGEYWDYETKRYYLRVRYYSPATGRFTPRDKFLGFYTDPLSLNRYTYAHNNPIKYIDPSGYLGVVLIEHQSIISDNLPLRLLLYIARVYEKIIDKKAVYRQKLIKLPMPELVILYNGKREFPDDIERICCLYA